MISTVRILKDHLDKVISQGKGDYIIFHFKNSISIIDSNTVLENIFNNWEGIQTLEDLISGRSIDELIDIAADGKGLTFIEAATLLETRENYSDILFISLLKDYGALILLKGEETAQKDSNLKLVETEKKLKETTDQLSELNFKLEKHSAELEKTYKKLIASEEVFRQLAENTNDIFWLRDDKEIIYINNQFERIWGYKKELLIENPYKITEWVHPEDVSNMEPWVNIKSLSKGSPYVEQYRIVKPDGEIRWLKSRIFPVFDKEDQPYRLVGIASDITEQKDFEDAILVAKEKAQESDMLKSTFLANISHEIRTPMNGIVGFAELISREDLDSATRSGYVSIMKKSSEQLVRIIDDIIDFAKLEANQIHIAQDPINLNTLLDQIFMFFENQMVTQELSSVTLLIKKKLPDSESIVLSDEQRIRQVFTHLIDNALKYTSEGFVEFGYELIKDKVQFFVNDSGLGIPKDKHDLIFERFRQVDEGHTRKYGGTGLGLPISKGLVNLLGGSIWLDSMPEKGTSFYFTIPHKVESIKTENGVEGHDVDEKYLWKDKLILVAEDDELNFEYIKIVLEPTQAKVIRAKDGSQAVKICTNLNFDIILMDIRLPILNGIQATKQLREMGVKTPIVAQTAFAMDDDEKRCLDAGCDKYLAKPISKEKLFSVLDSLLK